MKTALLVIDIQKDYFPGGKFELVNPLAAAKNAYMILQCFREHKGNHVHIQHISLEPDAAFFIDQVNLRNSAHLVVHVVSSITNGDGDIHPVFREILAIMLELLRRREVPFLFKIPVVVGG